MRAAAGRAMQRLRLQRQRLLRRSTSTSTRCSTSTSTSSRRQRERLEVRRVGLAARVQQRRRRLQQPTRRDAPGVDRERAAADAGSLVDDAIHAAAAIARCSGCCGECRRRRASGIGLREGGATAAGCRRSPSGSRRRWRGKVHALLAMRAGSFSSRTTTEASSKQTALRKQAHLMLGRRLCAGASPVNPYFFSSRSCCSSSGGCWKLVKSTELGRRLPSRCFGLPGERSVP